MDSLFNILASKDFDEPPEINRIKTYIKQQYNAAVGVQLRDRDIVIIVSSSALANTLRLNGPKISRQCELNKRLTFRIN
jgi:hypothetical protein